MLRCIVEVGVSKVRSSSCPSACLASFSDLFHKVSFKEMLIREDREGKKELMDNFGHVRS